MVDVSSSLILFFPFICLFLQQLLNLMFYRKVKSESLDKNQLITSPITMAICVSVVIETMLDLSDA